MIPPKEVSIDTTLFFEPVAFLSISMLAGCTRIIEYFPYSSFGGLLTAGAISSITSLAYNFFYYSPDLPFTHTFLKKVTLLSVSILSTSIVGKLFNDEHLSLAPKATVALMATKTLAIALITKREVEPVLNSKHHYFSCHLNEWRSLGIGERSTLAQKFYSSNLSPISLKSAPLTENLFHLESFDDSLRLTQTQLSWWREKLRFDSRLSYYPNELFSFLQTLLKAGIDPLYIEVDEEVLPWEGEILYAIGLKEPIYNIYLKQVCPSLFENRVPPPSLDAVTRKLTPKTIEEMDEMLIWVWNCILINRNGYWEKMDSQLQSAFIKRFCTSEKIQEIPSFYQNTPIDISWMNDLSEDDFLFPNIHDKDKYQALFTSPQLRGQLQKTTMALFNRCFPNTNLHKLAMKLRDLS